MFTDIPQAAVLAGSCLSHCEHRGYLTGRCSMKLQDTTDPTFLTSLPRASLCVLGKHWASFPQGGLFTLGLNNPSPPSFLPCPQR